MKKLTVLGALFIILLLTLIRTFAVGGKENDIQKCRVFLEGYGWQTADTPTDSVQITVPKTFDNVYTRYNVIQQSAGLDLSPYCGKSGLRYTFTVTNYPTDVGETVYANVIIIGGNAVGGDIMTVSLNGFMHALNENQPR